MSEDTIPQFNLVDSPWIKVQKTAGELELVSLEQLFREGYSITKLAHESALEDSAMLAFLEPILLRSSFFHFADAEDFDLAAFGTEARRNWIATLREKKVGNFDFVLDYLQHEDIKPYFELFHPKHPFMQVADLHTEKSTFSPVSRILLDSDSDHFSMRAASGKGTLDYADAARKLITVQAYDYSGIKSGAVGDPRVKGGRGYPIGVGWQGATGRVILHGENIFETLLLNLPISRLFEPTINENGEEDFKIANDLPVWEREPFDGAAPRSYPKEITTPTGPCDTLTWQSRRVRLFPKNGQVTGVLVSNGDKASEKFQDGIGCEDPWTGLRYSKNQSKKGQEIWMPLQHNQERTFWRGLDALLVLSPNQGGDEYAPKKPQTIQDLSRYFPHNMKVQVQLVGVVYGNQNAVIESTIDESIPVELALLTDEFPEHTAAILENSQKSMDAAIQLGRFAGSLLEAAGQSYEFQPAATEAVLHRLEKEFRIWLSQVTHEANPQELKESWQKLASSFFKREVENMLIGASSKALIGRIKDDKLISAATAQRACHREFKKIFPLAYEDKTQ